MSVTHAHTNRLAREKSPYLLQHQHNPVDWYAWGDEAFAKARKENKPIFLSIGYSTCHWCHVMERESFEDENVAAFLNKHFVSIKVDREERPDVDKIYMTTVQIITGQGGWPLNCFLTPDLKPFYAGTYFPPESRYGRVSFLDLLKQIANVWENRHDEVLATAADLSHRLITITNQEPTTAKLSVDVLKNAAIQFKQEYDPTNGGFGDAPKFPRPSQPLFVLRYGTRARDQQAINMVLHTCDAMAAGGMYDQLGGGFARYSVDAQWLVPHFEKMLYDNAQLVNLYLDAYLVSGKEQYAQTVRETIQYVLRDMSHRDGGFYSAEDADSEGKEGKFYCWTSTELKHLLTPEELKVVTRYFGITEQGNFVDHSDPNPLPNQNVLSIVDSKLSEPERKLLDSAKKKMFDVRAKRVRPHLDDKVLASWNGLMLGAIARAYATLGDSQYRAAAEKNLAFIQSHLWDAKSKTLYHRWRDGERDNVQLLDAYAYLLSGVLDLYEATLESRHLQFAIDLAESMNSRFYDPKEGGFYESAEGAKDLIMRTKEDYDGAEPSGNSVASLALLKLAAITDNKNFKEHADKTLQHFSTRLREFPQAVPHMLLALDFLLHEPRRAVVVQQSRAREQADSQPAHQGHEPLADARGAVQELLHAIHSVYQPNKVVLSNLGPVEEFAKTLPTKDAPVVFLCTGTACQPPTKEVATIKKLLAD